MSAKHPTTRSIDLSQRRPSKKRALKRIEDLQLQLLREQTGLREAKRLSVVIAFEGMDAAGKGGAIRRLTSRLDPRGFSVHPIGAPEKAEREHHYLWRFHTRMPRRGQITIFDRSWYGRVLVERVDGFCAETEWKRAYREINEFEKTLADDDILLLKFWLHVSKKEQLKRFRDREKDPFKNYKITDDDWHNRKKWNSYIEAADEMFRKTHTRHAPWNAIAGEDKRHARIEVLEKTLAALRRARSHAKRVD